MKKALLFALLVPLIAPSCTDPSGSTNRYLSGYRGSDPSTPPSHDPDDPGAAIPDDVSYWSDEPVKGGPSIRISLGQQKAFFFKGEELVGVSRISTGKEGTDTNTPLGTYKVTQKSKRHRSNLYGIIKDKTTGEIVNDDADMSKDTVPPGCEYVGAPMWNFLRFNGGIGMHTGYLPGYAASHGCVRMPHKMSEKFYKNAPLGTPVIVER